MAMAMNWELLNQQQQQQQQNMGDSVQRQLNPFIKFTPGTHTIRPLPVGNYEDSIPYKTIKQHCVQKSEEGRRIPFFALCWNWMFEAPQRTNTLAPLGKMQKLTKKDASLWQNHGCPFCKAQKVMDSAGVDKQFVSNLAAKTTNMWNILKRAAKNSDEVDTVFVWNMSNKLHVQLRDMMIASHQQGMDILDTTSGFDWMVQAQGDGLQRRYTLSMWPQPKPVTGDIVPYNLMDIAARSFRTYQETIDLLKHGAGTYLTQIGYNIPGDLTFENMTGTVPVEPVTYNVPSTLPVPSSPIYMPEGGQGVSSADLQRSRQQVVAQHTPKVQESNTQVIDDTLFIDGIAMF